MTTNEKVSGIKMTPDLWNRVTHFNENERWGDPSMMDVEHVFMLSNFRVLIRGPFDVHCAYELNGHASNSMHKEGKATDGHVGGVDLLQMFIVAVKVGFTGIGLYEWGIHLDTRPGNPAIWCKLDGKYYALTAQRLDILRMSYRFKKPR